MGDELPRGACWYCKSAQENRSICNTCWELLVAVTYAIRSQYPHTEVSNCLLDQEFREQAVATYKLGGAEPAVTLFKRKLGLIP